MLITSIENLPLEGVQLINFKKFRDNRGFFTEPYRFSDLQDKLNIPFKGCVQLNNSFSNKNVLRGLHFQWNPFMGKLVKTISGHMIDIVLDIRKASKTYGKAIAVNMPALTNFDTDQWIWVPPGFAHGNLFLADSEILYMCDGEYNGNCESGINPLSSDIDWTLCESSTHKLLNLHLDSKNLTVSEKDINAQSLTEWSNSSNSNYF